MNTYFLRILIIFSALSVATVAAYFSVFGISKFFAGATIAAIIMGTSLELGKLVLVSYLKSSWDKISKLWKGYYISAVIILMFITSVGIYGFLSNAYQTTSEELLLSDKKIETLDLKTKSFENRISNLKTQNTYKLERIKILSDLRVAQDRRLDSLYLNNNWRNAQSAKGVEQSIKDANNEITKLSNDVTVIENNISSLNDSLVLYSEKKLIAGNVTAKRDIGPLKYISNLTGKSMDSIVNWFIFLIIFVFDPLAISLIVAFNNLSKKEDMNIKSIKNTGYTPTYPKIPKYDINSNEIPDNIINTENTEEDITLPENTKEDTIEKSSEEIKDLIIDNTSQDLGVRNVYNNTSHLFRT